MPRTSTINRQTSETQITLSLNLDGTGKRNIDTPLNFLNHMLDILAKHSLIDIDITATGDTHIDDHHLTEDISICLGNAISEALGDKIGITRYGSIMLPMDEVLIACAIDLGGRFSFATNYEPVLDKVGDFSTDILWHFFESIAVNAKMNLHLQYMNPGKNEHHRIEAAFKAFARSLRQAIQIDQRAKDQMPSTKGTI